MGAASGEPAPALARTTTVTPASLPTAVAVPAIRTSARARVSVMPRLACASAARATTVAPTASFAAPATTRHAVLTATPAAAVTATALLAIACATAREPTTVRSARHPAQGRIRV